MRVVREVFLLPLIGIFFLCPLALGYSVEFSKYFIKVKNILLNVYLVNLLKVE